MTRQPESQATGSLRGRDRQRIEPGREAKPSADRKGWTVLELLRWTTRHFAARGIETPRLDAELLLASALGSDRLRLYVDFDRPVNEAERSLYRNLVRRRAGSRVPVAQLLGRREFWSLPLVVTPDVLVPRPETETLVAAALEWVADPQAERRVLEIGTGSGAVALALASELPGARVVATDLSCAALEVARGNARALGLAERVSFVLGDLYEPVAGQRFDLLVSNPPYLGERQRATLAPELAHEPELALFAGEDGLAVLRRLVDGAADALEPGGALAFELAPQQAPVVADWCRVAGLLEVRVHRDLARLPRVVSARTPEGK